MVVTAVALAAARVPLPVLQVPLVVGLTVVTAVSNLPSGDYELVETVTSASASDGITLNVMVDLPSNDSKKTEHVSVTRHVLAADLKSSHAFKYLFTSGDQPEYPGTTAISTLSEISDKAEKRNWG